jgi:pyridoxamine 5'-phosphate oxidase
MKNDRIIYKKEINPINQFQKWFNNAINTNLIEPNAFNLATVGDNNIPSIRTVLLKSYDYNGFIFFSNKNSKKATQISQNPNVAMHFLWLQLNRQIKIEGRAEEISKIDMIKYIFNRKKGSNISQWISLESNIITAKTILENKFDNMRFNFSNRSIEFPSLWNGYIIKPTKIEFWQSSKDKLHISEEYRLINNRWDMIKL